MTPAGERAYEENKHKSGLYAYENEQKELTAEEERLFRDERGGVGRLGEAAAELSQERPRIGSPAPRGPKPVQSASAS